MTGALHDAQGRPVGSGGVALTDEQAIAVERREGRLLLSANAGAGKTTVLVERFVREVIESRVAADRGEGEAIGCRQILAITFTRKAAGELRSRIRARFTELGELEDARDVEGAWISTIDGFCARVLRTHALVAGLDPDFVVLDEAQTRELLDTAFDRALGRLLGDGGSADDVALQLVGGFGYDQLHDAIVDVHERLRNADSPRRLPDPPVPDVAAARARLVHAADQAAAHLEGCPPGRRVDEARERLRECREALAAGGDCTTVQIDGWGVGRGAGALRDEPFDDYRAAVIGLHDAIANRAARPLLVMTGVLLELFDEEFARAKAQAGGLDFTDLTLHARDLLRDHAAIAAGYRRRLKRVMVDEFQDTNRLQLDLLAALGIEHQFMVGDALQSIYGFRNADVQLFRDERGTARDNDAYAELRNNFRSHPEILALINAAFAPEYEEDWTGLVAPPQEPAATPRVELLVTDGAAWAAMDPPAPELLAGMPAATRPGDAAEALLIAQRLRELIDDGAATAGEIAVLVRAGAKMPLYERALERAGVPVVAAQGRGWWGRLEVQDLLHHLRVLLNPRDEEALFGVLASPLAGVNPDTLALLALDRRDEGGGRAWDALERAVSGGGEGPAGAIDEAQRDRLRAYAALVAREREASAWAGAGTLLERVVRETGYDVEVVRRAGGPRGLANVRKLVRLARAHEQRRGGGLRAFVDHAAAQLAANVPTPDAPVDAGEVDAVRLMTVHGAKGLEFGVVVVADLGRTPPGGTPRILIEGGRVGLRVISVDRERHSAFDYDELKAERRTREAGEERRIMHVAVTRAERLLILSAALRHEHSWPKSAPGAPPIAWMGRGILGDVAAEELLADVGVSDEVREVRRDPFEAPVRVVVNAPRTIGQVLRLDAVDRVTPAPHDPAAAPPGVVPPAADAPAPPAAAPTLSYSSLSAYASCGYRWYLQRVLGLADRDERDLPGRDLPRGAISPRDRGTLTHVLLEGADLAAGADPPSADVVRSTAAALGITIDDEQLRDQERLLRAVLDGPLRGRLAGSRRELGFSLSLDPDDPHAPLMMGFIDALTTGDEGSPALVVDYKTDALQDGDDLEELVRSSYGVQRAVYALAVLRAGVPAVDVVHLYLERPAHPVVATFTTDDVPALQATLKDAARGLLAGDYPVSSRPWAGLCGTCPGRGGLCSHPDELTGRADPDEAPAAPDDGPATLF